MATNDDTRVRTSVILPQDAHDQLVNLAQENDASVAWVIRKAIMQYLGGKEDELKKLDN